MTLRKKRLNVLNSQKIFNLEVRERAKEITKVSNSNKAVVYKELTDFLDSQKEELVPERIDIHYVVEYDKVDDLNFYQALVDSVDKFTVVTKETLPLMLLDLLAGSPKVADVVYDIEALEQPDIVENAMQAYAGTRVSILYSVDKRYSSFKIRQLLYKVKFNVNELIVHWEGSDYEKEYDFYTELRNPLSGWGIVIAIETTEQEEAEYLLKRKAIDSDVKQSYHVWGR